MLAPVVELLVRVSESVLLLPTATLPKSKATALAVRLVELFVDLEFLAMPVPPAQPTSSAVASNTGARKHCRSMHRKSSYLVSLSPSGCQHS
jgi:hypothetical protein